MKVEVQPQVDDPGVVTLRFTSGTDGRADEEWLARSRAFLKKRADGDYFELDPPAAYLGRVVHRRPYSPEELIALSPGQSVSSLPVDLTRLYRLGALTSVRVRYRGEHPLRGPEQAAGPFDPVEAEWTTVSLPSPAQG